MNEASSTPHKKKRRLQQPKMSVNHPNNNNKNNNTHNNRNDNRQKSHHNVALSKALSWITRHAAPKLNLPIAKDGYIPLCLILKCNARNMNRYTVEDVKHVVESNDKQRFSFLVKKVRWLNDRKSKCIFVDDESSTTDGNGDGNANSNSDDGGKRASTKGSSSDDCVEDVLCIRANQGHSISTIHTQELLTLLQPNDLLSIQTVIHGTNKEAWENHILHEGLNKMNRNHIHFASGLPSDGGVISGMRKSSQVYIYVDVQKCIDDGIQFYKSSNGVILTEGRNGGGILPVQYFEKVIDARTNEKLM